MNRAWWFLPLALWAGCRSPGGTTNRPPSSGGLEPPPGADAGTAPDLASPRDGPPDRLPPAADGPGGPVLDAPAPADGATVGDGPGAADASTPDANAPPTDGPSTTMPLTMTPSEWEWENPRPFGDDLTQVWSAGPDDTWAVGTCGTIVHWNGQAWTRQTGQPDDGWWGLWGRAANDVWIVGDRGRIAHHAGKAWSQIPAPTDQRLRAVWGAGGTEVWAVGEGGTIVRWNGSAWSAVPSPTTDPLTALAGNGPADIWAVGGVGATESPYDLDQRHPTALHYDGQRWNLEPPVTDAKGYALLGAWATGGETWVLGAPSKVLRRAGAGWTAVGNSPTNVVRLAV